MAGLIAGLELGNKVINRPVRQDPRMAVFIANVCPEGTGRTNEPTLIIGRRTFGKGRSFMVPLSSAWQYNELAMLDAKLEQAASFLFNTPFPSQHEKSLVGDVILQYLPELFTYAPDTAENQAAKASLERTLGQYQVKVTTSDGKIVVDASEGRARG